MLKSGLVFGQKFKYIILQISELPKSQVDVLEFSLDSSQPRSLMPKKIFAISTKSDRTPDIL